jgi:chromatin remodeling complex protein RSC6
MPRKTNTRKTTAPKKTRTKKVELEVQDEVQVETQQPPVSDVESPQDTKVETKKRRQLPSKEDIMNSFDQLYTSVNEEITRLRDLKVKGNPGVKFLRSLNKNLKSLRTLVDKSIKVKKPSNRKPNTNSGFLKPVKLSDELCKFTGWSATDLKSRVDVTKFICNYIKDHSLQNPDDRRQIQIEKDPKLKKLLKYNSKTADKPLTYYSLQTYMKPHFNK